MSSETTQPTADADDGMCQCERCGLKNIPDDGGDKVCYQCWNAEHPTEVYKVDKSPEAMKARLQNWLSQRTPPDIEEHTYHGVPMSSLSNMELRVIIHIMYVRATKRSET